MTAPSHRHDPIRADLRAMLGDGLAFSFMVGVGESYIAAFALALGLGDVAAGLVATVPMLVGALLQLVTPSAVVWLGSHKRWVVMCALLQALSFVPLAAGAVAEDMPIGLLYLTVSLYWGLGMATSPAWNTWAGTLVPPAIRTRYFARRARWSHVALLGGLAAGGGLLQWGAHADEPVRVYAAVFGLALVARSLSAWLLGRQREPRPVPLGDTRVSPRAIQEHVRSGGHGRLLVYLLVFQGGVWVAAPYFTPYMLGPIGLDYVGFTVLTGSAFLSRILALPMIGRFAHRYGTRRLLWLGSIGIVPVPCLWLVSHDFAWLFALQLLSGVSWAAFELATLLSFFEHIPQNARTSILSVYNLAYATAIVGGGAIGGAILDAAGRGPGAYVILLATSSVARLIGLSMLRGAPNVVPRETRPPSMRTLGVRPSAGAFQRPVLPTLEEDEVEGSAGPPPAVRSA